MNFNKLLYINNWISFYVELLVFWLIESACCRVYDGKDTVALVLETLVQKGKVTLHVV